jgi:hypothetical protein
MWLSVHKKLYSQLIRSSKRKCKEYFVFPDNMSRLAQGVPYNQYLTATQFLIRSSNSKEQGPSSDSNNKLSLSRNSLSLWNRKVHHCIDNSSLPVPVQKQINLINILQPLLRKIIFNIILRSTPRSKEWSRPFRFCNQNVTIISCLPHARYVPRPSHPTWFDHPNSSIFIEDHK